MRIECLCYIITSLSMLRLSGLGVSGGAVQCLYSCTVTESDIRKSIHTVTLCLTKCCEMWFVNGWVHILCLICFDPHIVLCPLLSREQPIYTTRAHVFQIDPTTKKNWVPASKQAVTVSYFYDSTRNSYRIISVDGSKVRVRVCRDIGAHFNCSRVTDEAEKGHSKLRVRKMNCQAY